MRRALVSATVALVISCGGSSPSEPSQTAAMVLQRGANAMAELQTVSATLKITKGMLSLQGFALVSAKTSVRLPTDSDTVYTVKQQDVSFGVEVVISGGRVYVHLPFSNFQEAPPAQAASFPDMAKLFDKTTGLPAVIPQGANPRYVSTEQVGGVSAYQIATTYTPEQVHSLLSQLSSTGPVNAKIWVDVSDHLIRKAILSGAFGDAGAQAAVEVDITGFNAAVSITSPSVPPSP